MDCEIKTGGNVLVLSKELITITYYSQYKQSITTSCEQIVVTNKQKMILRFI